MVRDHGREGGGAKEKGRKSKWVTEVLKRQTFFIYKISKY